MVVREGWVERWRGREMLPRDWDPPSQAAGIPGVVWSVGGVVNKRVQF